jgi:hypothetical protein
LVQQLDFKYVHCCVAAPWLFPTHLHKKERQQDGHGNHCHTAQRAPGLAAQAVDIGAWHLHCYNAAAATAACGYDHVAADASSLLRDFAAHGCPQQQHAQRCKGQPAQSAADMRHLQSITVTSMLQLQKRST